MSDRTYDELNRRIKELEEENKRLTARSPLLDERFAFLQTLLNSIVMPIFYKDIDGVYKDCNPAFAHGILGLSVEEVKGKSLFDLPSQIPPDLARKYHQQDLDLMAREGKQIYESKVQRSDGTMGEYVFYKSPTYKANGELGGIVGVMLDITDRKLIEADLNESHQRMKTLMEATHVGIVIHEQGRILDANPGICKMLGYSIDELIGKEVLSFFPPDQQLSLKEVIYKLEASDFDSRCFKKDGNLIPIAISGRTFPYKEKHARVAEIIDLSEREVLMNKLNQAIESVKTLEGLLPICAHCKKIRNDSGYWEQIEKYISTHADVQFSHGLCPACLKDIYGDKKWFKRMESDDGENSKD